MRGMILIDCKLQYGLSENTSMKIFSQLRLAAIYLFFLCLMAFTPTVFAQKLDSLRGAAVEYAGTDTNKVNLLLRLGKEYQGASLDSMWAVTDRALAMARKLKYAKGEADALLQLAYTCVYKTESDKAIALVRQADPVYASIGDYVGRIKVNNLIAIVYYRNVQYDSSLVYFNKILPLAEKGKAYDHQGKTLVSIGTIYVERGNFPEAVKYYLDGLKVQERINDKENISITLSRIASTYASLKDKAKALEYIDRCVAYLDGIKDMPIKMSTYANIGSVYGTLQDNQNALKYFKRTLYIADSVHDMYWHNIATVDIAETYYQLKDWENARVAYTKAMYGAEKIGQSNIYSSARFGVGAVLLEQGKPAEALKYLQDAYDIFSKNGVKEQMREAAADLSRCYEQMNDYQKALGYHKQYVALKDSVQNKESNNKIQQLAFDYQIEKERHKVKLMEKDADIAAGKSRIQKVAVTAMTIGLALMIVTALLLFRSRQYEKRTKEQLIAQKEEIQKQAAELEQLNTYKDKTFSVLSHDLRGPLNSLSSTMMLVEEGVMSPDDLNEALPVINRQLASLNMLVDNLLNWAKSHMQGAGNQKIERVDVSRLVADNLAITQVTAEQKGIDLINDTPAGIAAMADAGQLNVVIRNLLNNAIKFTGKGGRITVRSMVAGKQLSISVADTGVGMTREQQDKLFKATTGGSTYGTAGEKGVGIGLLLSYEFVKANSGEIAVESQQGIGTTFTVTLPAA